MPRPDPFAGLFEVGPDTAGLNRLHAETKASMVGCSDLSQNDLAEIFEKYHYADPHGAARFARSANLRYRFSDSGMLAVFLLDHALAPDMETARLISEDIRGMVLREKT